MLIWDPGFQVTSRGIQVRIAWGQAVWGGWTVMSPFPRLVSFVEVSLSLGPRGLTGQLGGPLRVLQTCSV